MIGFPVRQHRFLCIHINLRESTQVHQYVSAMPTDQKYLNYICELSFSSKLLLHCVFYHCNKQYIIKHPKCVIRTEAVYTLSTNTTPTFAVLHPAYTPLETYTLRCSPPPQGARSTPCYTLLA